ncbi:FAD-dependent oxidoreductase, partial [Staphylococcus epidermidis]|uniref:FAD-dependent oxidoreductase n=1 Tax=Staphylococcus epidermidis TaxID=1282 RepID=UPI00164360C6
PTYSPSIHHKFLPFNHKPTHQLFLQPQPPNTNDVYVQPLSTSLPQHLQPQILQTIPPLQKPHMIPPAYPIQYHPILPTQLSPTLQTKPIKNLYTPRHINATSRYQQPPRQAIIP